MARWYCEDPVYSQISKEEKDLRDKIVAILAGYTCEMEGYSYYGSNPGIKEEDYEDIAEAIMAYFKLKP